MRLAGSIGIRVVLLVLLGIASGCVASARRGDRSAAPVDFFPLTPGSSWEYVVARRTDGDPLRLIAVARPTEFVGPAGQPCRIVDERYGAGATSDPTPILYCSEGGFLHRVMSVEYRGESLEDTGLRSAELKFLPANLPGTTAWEGRTSAYRLPDGSGFEVRQLHQVYLQAEPIDVPAGRFEHCARVETTAVHSAVSADGSSIGARLVYYYSDWYAPGVGLIRTEQRSSTSEVLATMQLVTFRIASEPSRR